MEYRFTITASNLLTISVFSEETSVVYTFSFGGGGSLASLSKRSALIIWREESNFFFGGGGMRGCLEHRIWTSNKNSREYLDVDNFAF